MQQWNPMMEMMMDMMDMEMMLDKRLDSTLGGGDTCVELGNLLVNGIKTRIQLVEFLLQRIVLALELLEPVRRIINNE